MPDRDQIITLFESTEEVLRRESAAASIELELSQLHKFTHAEHERTAVLFDLALEELQQPGAKKRYFSISDLAQNRVTDSSVLNKALQRFERIVQAPFQIKSASHSTQSTTTSYRQPIRRAAKLVVPAPARDRFKAMALDTLICALISALITFLLLPFLEASPLEVLGVKEISAMDQFVPLFAFYLKTLLLVITIYPLSMLLTRGKTYGFSYKRIKLVSDNGSPPSSAQIMVRGLLTPLSIITLSVLTIARGKKSPADIFSRTTISRI